MFQSRTPEIAQGGESVSSRSAMRRGVIGVAAVALLILTNVLLAKSGSSAPADSGVLQEQAQQAEDDYDPDLEEPIIEGDPPRTWEEFARDARTGGTGEPIVLPAEGPNAVTIPGSATLID